MRQGLLRAVGRVLMLAALTAAGMAEAAEIRVGVAANFAATLASLAERFERHSGHRVILSAGSTGKLYAQIKNGAPLDLFLAADAARPQRLEAEGSGVPGTRFTYATGRIVLWSPQAGRVDGGGQALKGADFNKLAIANPVTAPYGLAAQQAMQRLGVWEAVQPRLVRGENIAQTFQFVASGNADLGFVALAQIRAKPALGGSLWLVPATYHDPIEQQAILLQRSREPQAARALLAYLRSAEVREELERLGYGVPQP